MLANNSVPFTYLIGWSKLDKWYYGVRYSKRCQPADLWTSYFTSSPIVKKFREANGEPDVIEVRKTFKTSVQARIWEDKVHHRLGVVKSPKWLNQNYGNRRFITNGHFCGKDINGNIVWVSKNDPRIASGEICGIQKGMVTVRDSQDQILQVSKSDPRYISGELVSVVKGTALAYDPQTSKFIGRFNLKDHRWKTGEWVGSPTFKNKIATNLGMLDRDDHRLVSGEAVHTNANNSPAKDTITGQSLGRIPKSDPRWASGKITGFSKGLIPAKDARTHTPLGNISKSDPRWASGEIIAMASRTSVAKDAKTGQSLGRIRSDDPRWATGEIVGARKQFR